jgi:hypothetical protein
MRADAFPAEDPETLMTLEDNTACFLWLADAGRNSSPGLRLKAKGFSP